MNHDWWKTLFHGLFLEAWRRVPTPEQNRSEADFLVRELDLKPGARVLDVPCGFGRLSIELAARGMQLTGIDLCEPYLTEARAAAAQRGVEAEFFSHDMREIPWSASFDGAFCFGNSFAYFEDEGNQAFLAAAARALKPGARLVLDTLCAEMVLPALQERTWGELGDLLMLSARRYDVATQSLESRYTLLQDSRVETATAVYRVYTFRELKELLEAAGFQAVRGLGDFAGKPLELRSQRCLVVATRG